MTFLKWTFIVILGLIACLLIVAFFVKNDYSVDREIVINQPKDSVFSYIKYLKNQDNFSKWASMDKQMKKEYKGTDGTVGFSSAWDSDNKDVGKGEQIIKSINEGENVEYTLHFIKPFEGFADAYLSTDSISATSTKVKWGFESKMKYPMNLLLLFMNMEDMIGKDLEVGLGNLKKILEK